MVTVHAAQALFVTKQMVSCAVAVKAWIYTVMNEYHSVCDYSYMRMHWLVLKNIGHKMEW